MEPLPGQFDQRADSAAQCIQLQSQGDRPTVRSAKVYVLEGTLSEADITAIKKYVINAVESREATMDKPETLAIEYAIPETVATVEGFISLDAEGLSALLDKLGLAMDLDDLTFLQTYFRDEEKRDPTITEIRVVDTYWSDHCRHTTFSTHIDGVKIDDPAVQAAYERYLDARVEVYGEEKAAKRPQTLMDIATIAGKTLKKRGLLPELDESEEINACSIHVVLYARESNHEGADESLERQKEKLKDFCAEKGYDIADEVAIIGSREESLPALKKAIEFAQATPSRTILMASSNRVVGTASEMESIAELVNKSGVIIHTMDGSYEYADQYHTTPEAIMASTLAGFDADIDEDNPDEDEGMGGMSL